MSLQALYQRLKELDRDQFEKLCFHLLKAKYPLANVRHVEGKAGDEGIDSYAGRFDGKLVIWQCKSFANGVGANQQSQIRESLKEALKNNPRFWVLCVSVDLDPKALRWFERLADKHKKRLKLGLIDGSMIVDDLIYYHEIREAFFPGAVIDMLELQKRLSQRTRNTINDLGALAANDADQLIRTLERRDPRLSFELQFTRNRRPQQFLPKPGLLASLSDGTKTIEAFARDVQALQLSPPGGSFKLSLEGLKKFQEFERTGRPQTLNPTELRSFTSDFDFLLPEEQGPFQARELRVERSAGTLPPPIPIRLTFGSGPAAVVYDYLELKFITLGKEEAELIGSGGVPFELKLRLMFDQTQGNFEFFRQFEGHTVREVLRFMNGFRQLSETGTLELFNLSSRKIFFEAKVDPNSITAWSAELEKWIEALAEVSQQYAVELPYSETLSLEDRFAFTLLKGFIDGIYIPITTFEFQFRKEVAGEWDISNLREDSPFHFRFLGPSFPEKLMLLGIEVPSGPVAFFVDKGRFDKVSELREEIARTEPGKFIHVRVLCDSLVSVRRYVPPRGSGGS